ncbi:unnamed protein product [Caenorhabditis angaria]|uniref:Uncharacterized protein n=1 Tax=Caenorhabditis angaria TaxID=860376 RepID=A0A9P1MW87_9PELO|nr:unnamed protein product [Caenorhabditis angaria]
MSIYQKRWSSCGSGTTPTASSNGLLSSGVEPSTVGTSWNSVRWNKPSTSYRDRLASRFETNKSDLASMYIPQSRASSSRFSSSAAKNAADIASIGPSVSARASRFDSLSMPNREKYRSEARDLINKWSSRERTTSVGNQTSGGANSNSISSVYRSSYEPRTSSLTTKSTTPSYRSTTSLTPTRTSEIMSRYSSDRNSVLSPSPTPISLHTTPKADRPWRQRLAESSRIRSTLGDDVSEGYTSRRARNASSRRGSLSQDGGESSCYEFVNSYSGASVLGTTYRSRQPSTETSSYFSPSTRFTTSTYPTTTYTKRSTVAEIPPLKNAVERQKSSSIIRESSKERDVVRKKSVRERTARRASRQNSQQQSSSDEELTEEQKKLRIRSRSNSAARLRKLRKKSEILDGVQYKVTAAEIEKEMKTSLQSLQSLSHYETGAEDGSIVAVPMGQSVPPESEGFQSCAASPLVPTISRSSSKNGVVKNQVIKSPSLIEVLGVSKDNDESQYSAVAHFKPKKRARPVPGMWKSTTSENEEFISRNKSFHKSDAIGEVEMIMAILKTIEKIEKSLKIGDGKEKEKKVVKKKVIVTKRKKSSPIVLEVKEPVVAENKTPNEVAKPKTEVKPKTLVESKIGVKLKEESKPKITEAKPKEEPKPKTAEMKSKVSELKPKEEVKPKVVESKSKEESKPKVAEVTKKSVVVTKEPAKKLEKTPEEPKKEPEPPKKIPMVTKEITKYFTPRNKTTFLRAEISKPIPNHRNIGLRCRCTTDLKIAISEHYRRKARQERATVLVDTPIEGKNQARLKLKIRVPTPPPPSLPNIPDIMQSYMISESATEESAFSRSCSRQSDTRASIILDEMRNREADVEWIIKDGEEISDDLILPDQSILEQYVNRKRRRLRPSSICSSRGYESSNCASPCPSTVSELCLPSSVIVHEARKRAPNSAEPTVQMTSTPKGFTRNPPIAAIKPVPFEAPKTLFEKMIQDQANRNKSKNEKSAENELLTKDDDVKEFKEEKAQEKCA